MPHPPLYNADTTAIRETLWRFVATEIKYQRQAWEEARKFTLERCRRTGTVGQSVFRPP